MSINKVNWPAKASAEARLIEVVVFPTPPFWFATQSVRVTLPSLAMNPCQSKSNNFDLIVKCQSCRGLPLITITWKKRVYILPAVGFTNRKVGRQTNFEGHDRSLKLKQFSSRLTADPWARDIQPSAAHDHTVEMVSTDGVPLENPNLRGQLCVSRGTGGS